jgi:drug/metabolite transporter (DMT)-like permease
MSSNSPRVLPVASLLVGASLWGVIWYPMRLLEAGGLKGIWLTLVLYASALIASLPRTYAGFAELRHSRKIAALLMVSAGWTNIAFVEAVLEGNIVRVLLLFYLSPLWAALMGWAFLRERMSARALLSLALAMTGAVIMLWNPALGIPWPQGRAEWMAISAGFAFALSNVATRGAERLSIAAKALCVWTGVVVVAVVLLPVFQVPAPQVGASVLAGAAALGVLGIMFMTLMVQYGVTHMPVHRSAVIVLIELVAGAVSQQLLTNEVIKPTDWAGGVLIVLGAALAARASAKHGDLQRA